MDILVDTGVLLRLADPADRLHATVDHAVRVLRARGDVLTFAVQNAAEFWNVCTRPTSARGGWGLDTAEADRRLKAIESAFSSLIELPTA